MSEVFIQIRNLAHVANVRYNSRHWLSYLLDLELSPRTDKDVEAIDRTFKEFNMPVTVKQDKIRKDTRRIMKDMEKKNFEKFSCVVTILPSHVRMNAKDGWFRIHDLITSRLIRNKSLKSKPKIVLGNKAINVYSANIWLKDDGYPSEMLQFYITYEGYLS